MLYFDPSLQLGLIRVTVTPLRGDDWSPDLSRKNRSRAL
jgi:hypothetical protein